MNLPLGISHNKFEDKKKSLLYRHSYLCNMIMKSSLFFILVVSLIYFCTSELKFSQIPMKFTIFSKVQRKHTLINKLQSIQGGSNVEYITSISKFDSVINDPSNAGKLLVIDFTATWCGPCKMIAPFFDDMSTEFQDSCVFIKVDVDQGAEIAQAHKVMSMPTFLFFKDGQVVDRFSGASVEKLRQVIYSKME